MRIAGGAAAAAAVLLIVPVPAAAGGPTSVLLASPSRGVAAALYHSDAAYDRLHKLVGENPTADPAAPALHGGPGSSAVNLTWMVHDVQVWRVDRVFVNLPDGPWIETHMLLQSGSQQDHSVFEKAGVLHRPSNAKELLGLLETMRLTGPDAVSNQGIQGPAPARDAQPVSAPVAPVAAERDVAPNGWVWLLVGAAGGAVLAISLRPLFRRVRPN